MHRLEAVADVGQRSPDDDRHRVVDVAALHLGLDVDRLDPIEPARLLRSVTVRSHDGTGPVLR